MKSPSRKLSLAFGCYLLAGLILAADTVPLPQATPAANQGGTSILPVPLPGRTLKNGAPWDGTVDPALPRALVLITIPGGPGLLPPASQAIPPLLAKMLTYGPVGMPCPAYEHALFLLNSEISYRASWRAMIVSVTAPVANLKAALSLAFATLRQPKLDDAGVLEESLNEQAMEIALRDENSKMDALRYFAWRDAFAQHPFVMDGDCSMAEVMQVPEQVDRLAGYYAELMALERAWFSVVTPGSLEGVDGLLNEVFFPEDAPPAFQAVSFPALDVSACRPDKLQVTVVHKENETDNQIIFLFPDDVRGDEQAQVAGKVAHDILGGQGMTSRLMTTLREERGLTYYVSSARHSTSWNVSTFGDNKSVVPLLQGVLEVIQTLRAEETVSSEAVQRSVRTLLSDWKAGLELPMDRALEQVDLRLAGTHAGDWLDLYPKMLRQVTPQDVKDYLDQHLDPEKGRLYLLGDKNQLLPMIQEALGVAPEQVTVVELPQAE